MDKKTPSMPILVWGFVVSFLGSLPPGTTNVLMVQLAATQGYLISTWFAFGCMIAEVICVQVCLMIMGAITQPKRLTKSFQWLSLIAIVWLIIASFTKRETVIPQSLSPFTFGFILMILNPVQLPFWFGWTTILAQRKILLPTQYNRVLYVVGIALGSLIASIIFIAGGHVITGWILGKEMMIQWVFGSIFILIAIIQLWKILKQPRYQEQDQL